MTGGAGGRWARKFPGLRRRGRTRTGLARLCAVLHMAWYAPFIGLPALMGFAPYGRLTFFACAKKVSKETHPIIRPCASLRVPSFHHRSRGTPRRAIPGPSRLSRHPCRSTPYAAIPLGLLMGAWASPVPLQLKSKSKNYRHHSVCVEENLASSRLGPVRRPSAGVAQGDEPHGCGERLKGAGTTLVSRPPEQHRREGS